VIPEEPLTSTGAPADTSHKVTSIAGPATPSNVNIYSPASVLEVENSKQSMSMDKPYRTDFL